MSKAHKKLAVVIGEHGLRMEKGGQHYVIRNAQNKVVGSVSTSPSDKYFGRQVIRQLVRDGLVPSSLKELKF